MKKLAVEEGRSPQAGEPLQPLPEDALILIPVRGMVLFPGAMLPVTVGRPGSVAAAREAARSGRPVGLLLQRDSRVDAPRPEELHEVGTMANVLRQVTGADHTHHLVCQGESRFRVLEFLPGYPFLVARIEQLVEPRAGDDRAIEARLLNLRELAAEALELLPRAPDELINAVDRATDPGALADLIVANLEIKVEEKQEVLELLDLAARLDRVSQLLSRRIEVLRLSQQISEQTREKMDERQREALLREQLRTIQRELGEADGKTGEIEELERAIGKAGMPDEVEQQARKELRRLERIPENAGEFSMVRSYLEWLTELPWSVRTEESIDVARARGILDQDHYDLDKVKRRILEYLAVRKLNPAGKSPILCFVGPPGVGKTSLGQSIARATGRRFVRVSLGGVHDEAEIRGHRRTYIGALPGNVIEAIRKAGSCNPVLMLDEVDKLGAGIQGDPASALLEVLDPEQNATFRDNYLAVPFDLSQVLFVCTANVLDQIPGPLRDRMEIIELPGYTAEEKVEIARRYLVDRQLRDSGLGAPDCSLTDAALAAIVRDYTREAGCRSLERTIGSVCRSVAMQIAEGTARNVVVDAPDLAGILGPPRFEAEVAMRTSVPGVATGLAWTPIGGDILFIEASRAAGSGNLILTGQLGEVMKESAQTALSLVKAQAGTLGIDASLFDRSDIHVHVPAGAIPKDGPSAGVAMLVALVSLLTDRTVNSDTAMTGEVTLRGLVLPVGGIKEKTLAALRAGIRTVILPARNRKEFEEIPEDARSRLRFVWAERVDQVLAEALAPPAAMTG
ncbi:MAG TPA: endopeptidase La [Gammaproteobacteria bacterium]|nr:endopeptidase La [Gammaproteobacteria bacterium]